MGGGGLSNSSTTTMSQATHALLHRSNTKHPNAGYDDTTPTAHPPPPPTIERQFKRVLFGMQMEIKYTVHFNISLKVTPRSDSATLEI